MWPPRSCKVSVRNLTWLCAFPMQVVKLSDAVQELPRSVTEFVHGVPESFLAVGQAKAAPPPEGGPRFGKGAYFIGKVCPGARAGAAWKVAFGTYMSYQLVAGSNVVLIGLYGPLRQGVVLFGCQKHCCLAWMGRLARAAGRCLLLHEGSQMLLSLRWLPFMQHTMSKQQRGAHAADCVRQWFMVLTRVRMHCPQAIWAKGYTELLNLMERDARSQPDTTHVDCFGYGDDLDEVRQNRPL